MFDKYMKYGIDERGPFASPDLDVVTLVEFLKDELKDQDKTGVIPNQEAPAPVNQPLPGTNTVPERIPFNIPDVLPGRSTGYTHALKDIMKRFGTKFV